MLAGYSGFEFAGETYSNSYHTNAAYNLEEGCAICHMAVGRKKPSWWSYNVA